VWRVVRRAVRPRLDRAKAGLLRLPSGGAMRLCPDQRRWRRALHGQGHRAVRRRGDIRHRSNGACRASAAMRSGGRVSADGLRGPIAMGVAAPAGAQNEGGVVRMDDGAVTFKGGSISSSTAVRAPSASRASRAPWYGMLRGAARPIDGAHGACCGEWCTVYGAWSRRGACCVCCIIIVASMRVATVHRRALYVASARVGMLHRCALRVASARVASGQYIALYVASTCRIDACCIGAPARLAAPERVVRCIGARWRAASVRVACCVCARCKLHRCALHRLPFHRRAFHRRVASACVASAPVASACVASAPVASACVASAPVASAPRSRPAAPLPCDAL
jgi:hypothetical protein